MTYFVACILYSRHHPIIFITVISARNKIKMCNGIHCWMNIVM